MRDFQQVRQSLIDVDSSATFPMAPIAVEEPALLVYSLLGDPRLPALSQLARTKSRRRLLGRVSGDDSPLLNAKIRTLRYKPERRYVAQLLNDN